MEPIDFVSPYYYTTYWNFALLVIAWSTILFYIGSKQQKILTAESNPSQPVAVIATILAAFYWGLRPLTRFFGDMWLYAMNYSNMANAHYMMPNLSTEWLWHDFNLFCYRIGLNHTEYFLAVDLVYYGGMLICACLLMRKNLWIAMVFFFTSFEVASFGTNGIRNGFATSIELIALAMVVKPGAKRWFGFFMMFLALGVHRSTIIPTTAAIMTLYMVKDTKNALRFWLLSIFLSLTIGPLVSELFMALGLDDRMATYYQGQYNEANAEYFSHTGFRWDFLIYSSFAPLMIWFVTQKRKFKDVAYTVIANVYLIANAFWIMVIRASYSNRFAYLSWFLYPVVIAYPLLRMRIWKDQDRKTAIILFLYSGFLFFMYFIYYYGQAGLGFESLSKYWWTEY